MKIWSQYAHSHGLRTPNEGINQRYLKIWADVADKNASAKQFGIGIEFSAVQWRQFPLWASVVRAWHHRFYSQGIVGLIFNNERLKFN